MRLCLAMLVVIGLSMGSASAVAECVFDPLGENGELTLGRPVGGSVIREFGEQYDELLKKKAPHDGVDLEAASGEPVYAARSGKVIDAGSSGEFGLSIRIDHGTGVETLYGHLSQSAVAVGQCIKAGEEIAKSGATGVVAGPHLHFGVAIDGKPVNPLDYLQ